MSNYSININNNNPVAWGAILYATGTNKISYPISSSISNLNTSTILHAYAYDYLMVMPGFKVEVYSGTNYTGTLLGYGYNTYGVNPILVQYSSATVVYSVKLYYKGTVV